MSNHDTTMSDERPEKPLIDDKVKQNFKSRNTWMRFFYMLVFALILGLAHLIFAAVVIVQFVTVLLSGERNQKLLDFGASMSQYVFDIWRYLSFVSEAQPFPFAEWRDVAAPKSDSETAG